MFSYLQHQKFLAEGNFYVKNNIFNKDFTAFSDVKIVCCAEVILHGISFLILRSDISERLRLRATARTNDVILRVSRSGAIQRADEA